MIQGRARLARSRKRRYVYGSDAEMRSILIAAVLVVSGTDGFADTPAVNGPHQVIESCKFEYTELGQRARFRVKMGFLVETGSEGEVLEARADPDNKSANTFIVAESVVSCLKKWTLEPGRKYRVSIVHGAGEPTTYDVVRGETTWLRVVVPWM